MTYRHYTVRAGWFMSLLVLLAFPLSDTALAQPGRPIDIFAAGASGPGSLVFGPDGNLYVTVGNGVLRFDETGKIIDIFASGHGLDRQPHDIVFGPDGNLYVSNAGPQEILRFDGSTGAFIDVFVPSGSGGLIVPFKLAFGPDGNLYVMDNVGVLRYDGTTGAFIDVFTQRTGLGLTFGPDGNLYVLQGLEVERYDGSTGAFIDVFASGFSSIPGDLVFGPDGDLYVADYRHSSVVRFDGTTGAGKGYFVPPGSGGLYFNEDLAFGPDGNLYVSSSATTAVLRYDGSTGDFLDAFVPVLLPRGLLFDSDDTLYIPNSGPASVLRYDGNTGVFIDIFIPEGRLLEPAGMVFGPDGNLYATNPPNDEVLRYDGTTGAFLDVFVPRMSGRFGPFGLVFGPDGNLYVSYSFPHSVQRFNGTTGALIDVFVPSRSGGLFGPANLVFGPDGNLYVASRATGEVLRYDGTTGAFMDVFASGGGLESPEDLNFGPDGNLYVTSNNGVLRFDGSNGAFIDVFVPSGNGGLSNVLGLAFGPDGNLYVAGIVAGIFAVLRFEGPLPANAAPTADAGDDQTVTAGQTIQLDGSGSSDPNGDPLTYTWQLLSRPAGSTASLSDAAAVDPTFVADGAGDYIVQLIVNDGLVDSNPDQVTITAQPATGCAALVISDFSAAPNAREFVDVTNEGSDTVDLSQCVGAGARPQTRAYYVVFDFPDTATLAPGETFRFGSDGVAHVDLVMPNGSIQNTNAALALLDRRSLARGTPVAEVQHDVITSLVYFHEKGLFGFFHRDAALQQGYCTLYEGRLSVYAQEQCAAPVARQVSAPQAVQAAVLQQGQDLTEMLALLEEAAAQAEGAEAAVPEAVALEVNYPNPFNPTTTIRFALPQSSAVRLVVYDALGRPVRVLVEGPVAAGRHAVVFEGEGLPSGVYFYRLEAGGQVRTQQMLLMR